MPGVRETHLEAFSRQVYVWHRNKTIINKTGMIKKISEVTMRESQIISRKIRNEIEILYFS